MKKKLDDLAKPLSDDPKLIKKIKDRIRKNEEYRVKLKYVNLEGFVYVDEEEFYNFVKDNYKDKHPELIPRMPKEHQKIWKTETFYFDFSYRRDVDGVNETTDVEELRRLYWKKAGECQKLREEINQLKIKADRYDKIVEKNKQNALLQRKKD